MAWRIYCLQCHVIIGEAIEDGESDRDPHLGICQTCAQHGGAGPAPGGVATRAAGPGATAPPAKYDRATRDHGADGGAEASAGTDAAGQAAWCRSGGDRWGLTAAGAAIATALAASVRLLPAWTSRWCAGA
ncbi:MAG TPA: hypothetical protein VFC42_08385 [Methylomirabilota bacterium]|nr:hypothetical protein [Methylomirabilota bacterium]